MLDSIYGEEIRAKMVKLEWVDPKQFATLIAKEHAQMQAVFLAFLPPGMAGEGFLVESEHALLASSQEFLWKVRYALHKIGRAHV